jgi:ribose-phosphate pyrophosphokinase
MLFALPRWDALADAIARGADLPRGRLGLGRFANGELHATIETAVPASESWLLGSVAPPDEDLLATLLLSHTLRKEGARTVTALLPYLGYARQDHVEPRRSLAAAWVGALLGAAGVHEVVTVDVHSRHVHDLFPIPVRSLSPAAVFARWIADDGDLTVVAPDEGAIARAEAVRRAAGLLRPGAHFVKQRTPAGVVHSALHGEVGSRVVIVDDILDTGGTLVSACEALRHQRVETIIVMVTHGLFTGTAWERLWRLGVGRIYCTDSVPLAPALGGLPITVLSLAPLLGAHLAARRAAA